MVDVGREMLGWVEIGMHVGTSGQAEDLIVEIKTFSLSATVISNVSIFHYHTFLSYSPLFLFASFSEIINK